MPLTPLPPLTSTSDRCPCGTGDVIGDCCGPLLAGSRKAATAEQLMRSRFTAFARIDVDHALRSWHPRTCPSWKELSTSLSDGTRWLRLEVLSTEGGGPFDAEGTVEFRAHAKTEQGRRVLHERSRFVREDGAWVYLSGEVVKD